jgi:hypothetical protein
MNGRSVDRYAPTIATDLIDCEHGRAEVLLAEGVVLRIREKSLVRVLSSRFEGPRFDLMAGRVNLDVAGTADADKVTGTWKQVTIVFQKPGSYWLDTDPATAGVFDGEAQVDFEGRSIRIEKGQMLNLEGDGAVTRLDAGQTGEFDRWSAQRAAYLAMVRTLAANGIQTSSTCPGWDSVRGTITCVVETGRGHGHDASGSARSETEVGSETSAGSGPQKTASTTSAGTSGTIAAGSPASTTAGSASSAPVAREAGNAGGARR